MKITRPGQFGASDYRLPVPLASESGYVRINHDLSAEDEIINRREIYRGSRVCTTDCIRLVTSLCSHAVCCVHMGTSMELSEAKVRHFLIRKENCYATLRICMRFRTQHFFEKKNHDEFVGTQDDSSTLFGCNGMPIAD